MGDFESVTKAIAWTMTKGDDHDSSQSFKPSTSNIKQRSIGHMPKNEDCDKTLKPPRKKLGKLNW